MKNSKKLIENFIGLYKENLIYLLLLVTIVSCTSKELINTLLPKGSTYKNSIGIEFIEIPAGEFLMGYVNSDTEYDDSERPQHNVKITNSFSIGKFEATQGEWKKVMGNNPSDFVNCDEDCPVGKKSPMLGDCMT